MTTTRSTRRVTREGGDPFSTVIGQTRVKQALTNATGRALESGGLIPHTLLHGPAGTGKTTLSRLLSAAMHCEFVELHGTTLRTNDDLRDGVAAAVGGVRLKGLEQRKSILEVLQEIDDGNDYWTTPDADQQAGERPQIIFVDEIHRCPRIVQEGLYAVMDDGVVFQNIVKDALVPIKLPPTCVVGATTDAGLLTQSLRDRFGLNLRMEEYNTFEIARIGRNQAESKWKGEGYQFTNKALVRLALPSRFNPRLMGNLIDACVDTAWAEWKDRIDEEVVGKALELQGIDEFGIHSVDKVYLATLLRQRSASLEVLSMNTHVDKETLKSVIEPFLTRMGLISRSSAGRMLTADGVAFLKKKYGLVTGRGGGV